MNRKGRIFVISSPSGGGKTTLAEKLLERERNLVRSVSVTTRARRAGEAEGRDYFFVTEKQFESLRRGKGFLEWAQVFGRRYGTPRAFVEKRLRAGRDVLLVIDVQGARQVRRSCGEQAVLIFIMPPNFRELKARLSRRSSDSPGEVRKRLRQASREMRCARRYDYVIVNQNLNAAADELQAVVTAERLKN